MSKIKLKKCPFCGNKSFEKILDGVVSGHYEEGWAVVCSAPGCCIGPIKDTPAKAIEAWNKRATKLSPKKFAINETKGEE